MYYVFVSFEIVPVMLLFFVATVPALTVPGITGDIRSNWSWSCLTRPGLTESAIKFFDEFRQEMRNNEKCWIIFLLLPHCNSAQFIKILQSRSECKLENKLENILQFQNCQDYLCQFENRIIWNLHNWHNKTFMAYSCWSSFLLQIHFDENYL